MAISSFCVNDHDTLTMAMLQRGDDLAMHIHSQSDDDMAVGFRVSTPAYGGGSSKVLDEDFVFVQEEGLGLRVQSSHKRLGEIYSDTACVLPS